MAVRGTYRGAGEHTFPFVPLPHHQLVEVAKAAIRMDGVRDVEVFVRGMVTVGYTTEAAVRAFVDALAQLPRETPPAVESEPAICHCGEEVGECDCEIRYAGNNVICRACERTVRLCQED